MEDARDTRRGFFFCARDGVWHVRARVSREKDEPHVELYERAGLKHEAAVVSPRDARHASRRETNRSLVGAPRARREDERERDREEHAHAHEPRAGASRCRRRARAASDGHFRKVKNAAPTRQSAASA